MMRFEISVTVLFVIGIGIVLYIVFNYSWKRSKTKKAFRSVPFSEIEDVQDGDLVKIKGKVWDGGEKIRSPLSERLCVYYHVAVLHRKRSGDIRFWETLFEEEVMADVVLQSGDYFAVIQADSPIAHLLMDKNYRSTVWTDTTTANTEKYLKKHGYDPSDFWGMRRDFEFKEGILRRGEEFAVVGRARWISAKELKFKIPAQRVLLIYETEKQKVVLSEDPSLVKNEVFRHKKR